MNKIVENTQNFLTLPTDDYNDLLDRRKIAKNFLEVVKVQTANVYSINAPWGSGKTWFLKFIEDECKNQNIPFIQFNVWETDYAKDPFQAVLSELLELLQQQIKLCAKEDVVKEFQRELTLLERNAEDFLNLRKRMSFSIGLGTPLSPVSAQATLNPDNSSLAEYNEMKKVKYGFISNLRNFVNKFDKQLIIAIDELDRCRPDYAISTLEIIKHFFNIEGIKFILALDKEQLNRTIYSMFGNMPDTDTYLSKFVDIQYFLPLSDMRNFVISQINDKYPLIKSSLIRLLKNALVFNKSGNWYTTEIQYENYESEFYNLCVRFKLNLREIEKLSLKLSVILPLIINKKDVFSLTFLIVLILLNIKYNDVYERFKNVSILADNAEWAGKLYWSCNEFRTIYKRVERVLNDKRRYSAYDESMAEELISYCELIDFAEGFS